MAVITISRGSFSGGKSFAEHLGNDLGFKVLSREDLTEDAIKMGVPVGKLQTAMIKPPRVYNRMGREREQYIACMTSLLCERVLDEDIIYHGHTGHLLLSGIMHILRIRVLANMEHRINSVMQELNLSREKAKNYIDNVDTDRDKWIRFLYGIDWHNPSHYDLIVHLDQLGVRNASSALHAMADLPDFKLTPASTKAIQNLMLASKARFVLVHDARTHDAEVKVTADDGVVTVTYMPQYAEIIPFVPEILEKLPGCKEVRLGIARTSILWLQDKYDSRTEEFKHVLRLAKKWDAAVELMRLVSESKEEELTQFDVKEKPSLINKTTDYNGGIEEDVAEELVMDEDLNRALDELQKEGSSGGISTIYGDNETLIDTLRTKSNYSMMIVGNIFTQRASAARTRMTNELKSLLTDNIKIPVIGLDELEKQFRFGAKDFLKLILYLIAAAALFLIVFTNQGTALQLLSGEAYKSWRILVILVLIIFVPSFAYLYGTATGKILKIFGLD